MENYPSLFKYDSAMNISLVEHAIECEVSEEKFTKIAAHILGATQTWLYRLQGSTGKAPAIWPEQSLQQLLPNFTKVYQDLHHFLSSGKHLVNTKITYTNSSGKKFTNKAADILDHLLLHNSYHRGQLNLLLRQADKEPVPQDYIIYTRKNDSNGTRN